MWIYSVTEIKKPVDNKWKSSDYTVSYSMDSSEWCKTFGDVQEKTTNE